MCLIITGRGISRSPGNIPKDQPEMTEPPWLIAIKASDRASGAAVHHDLALQRSPRGTVITTIADAAVNVPPNPLLMFRTFNRLWIKPAPALRLIRAIKRRGFGKYWAGERPGTAERVA
jgi:hypothetical protein